MTLNDQIEALVLKNAVIKPVNMTSFKNPFLLLSTTRALNELVSNTAPSDRAKKEGIEDDKAYLKTPSGARSDRKAPKTGKDAPKQDTQPMPPKRKATPKPATSSVKTPKTATVPTKESKAASKKLVADALKGGMEQVLSAKGVADKIIKKGRGRPKGATNAPGVTNAPRKAPTAKPAVAKAETARAGNSRRRVAKGNVETAADKEMRQREELTKGLAGGTIPMDGTKLRGGNASDRRLGTKKTQKKKK